MKNKTPTIIELSGLSTFMECKKLNSAQLSAYVARKNEGGDGFEQLTTSYQDEADISVMGILPDTSSVIINGEVYYDDLDDINLNCVVISYPRVNLLDLNEDEFCFFHSEIEKGRWGSLEIEGEFDSSKLVFIKRQLELPNGDDLTLLTAEYDGNTFGYDSPDQISVNNSVYDYLTEKVA